MDLNIIFNILAGSIVAIFSSYLTSIWTMRKFYNEKWWERKEKAYTEIINALYDMVQYHKTYKDDYGQHDFISEDRAVELRQEHLTAFMKVHRATDLAALYVSDEAVKTLQELREREQIDFYDNPRWEFYELEYKYHKKALDKIIKIATKDLKRK